MNERFESFLKREINEFLQNEVSREAGVFISVGKVFARERSESAEVFVSIFPEEKAAEIFKKVKILERGARKFISSKSVRRFIPKIRFVLESGTGSMRLEKLLEKVKNE